ncbi:MAG: flavin reductase [Clostridia bacterium]|nr:flavin reductase [Clostridia bacterium]
MDTKALQKIQYGLFVLSAHQDGKDNACIVNTVVQVTSSPMCVAVTVNKQNYTHDMIAATNKFNISIIDVTAPFGIFERFGFQSGRTADKFDGFEGAVRTGNGLIRLTEYACAFISGWVVSSVDLGTHTMFIARVSDCGVLGDNEAMTYNYYHANVKPKPQASAAKGFRCKICGYIYEGDVLPADFVCPLCKHGAEDFERIE